eukprot:gb/GFBE01004730.1/.p1 GENE.gb/GFBE01004730.1/~~gb/GFBE01004730.1/.p1  ORF type:complete len:420 (+),score=69.82 gb/GFBE01004730.1/:1-1260(+)
MLIEVSSRGASDSEATLNLLNCLLGNSLLAVPWAFAQVGAMLGLLLLLVGTALNRYTLHLLLKHVDMDGGGSYPLIGRCAYGVLGETAVLAVYLAHSSGALCAYAVGLTDLVSQLGHSLQLGELPRWLTVLMAVGLCAPGMLQPSMKKVSIFSALSLGAAVMFCLVLVSLLFLPYDLEEGQQPPEIVWFRQDRLLVAWPIFGYVFAVQPGAVMVLAKLEAAGGMGRHSHMDEADIGVLQAARRQISGVAYGIALLVGALVGLASYMRFGELTRGNILESCFESQRLLWSGAITALQLSSCVMLLSSAAFMMVPCRFALLEFMKLSGARDPSEQDAPAELHRQVTFVFLCLMVFIAALCDDISTVYRVVGAVATQVFALILPGVFALKLSTERRGTLGPLAVACLGVAALLLCGLNLLAS